MGILIVGFIIARMLSSGGTSFRMTPTGMGLSVQALISLRLLTCHSDVLLDAVSEELYG